MSAECPACPVEVRNLAACAHNALGAMEAARDGHGGWESAWRELAYLKEVLEQFQPIMDAHFAGHGPFAKDAPSIAAGPVA